MYLADSRYDRMLPDTPHADSASGKTLEALRDMKRAWQKVDADSSVADFTPPLLLRGGYDAATFATEVETMDQRFEAVIETDGQRRQTLKRRDDLLAAAWGRMVQYRQAAEVEFAAEHALMQTLPDLTGGSSPPAEPPAGVTLTGTWDAASMTANLSWTESTAGDLVNYRVLYSPGPTWPVENVLLLWGTGCLVQFRFSVIRYGRRQGCLT